MRGLYLDELQLQEMRKTRKTWCWGFLVGTLAGAGLAFVWGWVA